MKRLKVTLTAILLSVSLVLPFAARAGVIELALVVDASGSINGSEWNLQRQGYSNAINAILPADGSVAVSVVRFGSSASVVRGMTLINDVTAKADLVSFFLTLSQSGNGGSTCISCGIIRAEETFTGTADRAIIDVSTDGGWNTGVNPAGPEGTMGTSAWAVENGAADVVNTIGIGPAANINFEYGPDSFGLAASSFENFEEVLKLKLGREIGIPVSEPAGAALLLLGLLGLVARRRLA
ncbi:DUF1194 domain-containing protein [uncultured Marinobacter sp.]|uniref:DUF1194 domain-containing protein n=1 Tax=uncultured Marinobacter sp. TaxID=187379 RepID=UPI0030DC7E00